MDNFDLRTYLAEGRLYKTEAELLEEGLFDVVDKMKKALLAKKDEFIQKTKQFLGDDLINKITNIVKDVVGGEVTEKDFNLANIKKVSQKIMPLFGAKEGDIEITDQGKIEINEAALNELSTNLKGWLGGLSSIGALTFFIPALTSASTLTNASGIFDGLTSLLIGALCLFIALAFAYSYSNDLDNKK